MVGHPPSGEPLMMDVRQSGFRPRCPTVRAAMDRPTHPHNRERSESDSGGASTVGTTLGHHSEICSTCRGSKKSGSAEGSPQAQMNQPVVSPAGTCSSPFTGTAPSRTFRAIPTFRSHGDATASTPYRTADLSAVSRRCHQGPPASFPKNFPAWLASTNSAGRLAKPSMPDTVAGRPLGYA